MATKEYVVTFKVTVEASDENDAIEAAAELLVGDTDMAVLCATRAAEVQS